MGHITKAPTYIDNSSFLSDKQIRKINSIIKSQINLVTSKAIQKQKEETKIESVVSEYADFVVSEIDYKYNDIFYITAYINTSSLSVGESYKLFSFNTEIKSISVSGYYDITQTNPISEYASFDYSSNDIVMNVNSLPVGLDIATIIIKGRI